MLSNFGNFFNKTKDVWKQVLLACRISLRPPTPAPLCLSPNIRERHPRSLSLG